MPGILKTEVKYYPYELPRLWAQPNFNYDEIKMNLLWLVRPQIDGVVNLAWGGDEVSRSIDAHLSRDVRQALNMPPIEFMYWWSASQPDQMTMTKSWPRDYMATMQARAKEANSRLIKTEYPNVFRLDFSKHRYK